MVADPPRGPDIATLTGLRSSKPTWYARYRSTAEHLDRALGSLEQVATVLSATGRGATALCEAVVDAVADHLGSPWVVLALQDDALPLAEPRWLARGPGSARVRDPADLPPQVRGDVGRALVATGTATEAIPGGAVGTLVVDGVRVGVLVACGSSRTPAPADLAILRILATQSAVALQSDSAVARSEALREQTGRLYAEAERRAADLAERHRELAEAHARLDVAAQREAVDAERHRIARELHDSVAQHVLSAGMTIEWCRPEVEHLPHVADRLQHAKELTREAVDRLRAAIHALCSEGEDDPGQGLPEMLARLPVQHPLPGLAVSVRVEGRPVPVPAEVARSLVRIAAEAVFNTAAHAGASRAVVRLSYRPVELRLSVADDGTGDPDQLRRLHRAALTAGPSGHHRGLANMDSRCREIGAVLRFGRARLGGVRVEVRLPLGVPLPGPGGPGG